MRRVGPPAIGLLVGTLLGGTVAAAQEVEAVSTTSLLAPGHLLSVGWIDRARELRDAPRILGSDREGRIEERSLTIFDRIHLPLIVEGRALAPGDRVQLFRIPRRVVDPVTGEPLGDLVVPTGVAEVDGASGEIADAVVVEAFAPILAGDRVRRVTVADTIAPGAGEAVTPGASGYVVEFQEEKAIHPPYDRLFLRREAGPGLGVGDAVELFRPGEVRNGRRLPDVSLARALVVRVDGDLAAAVLSQTYRSDLVVGDRFREVEEAFP